MSVKFIYINTSVVVSGEIPINTYITHTGSTGVYAGCNQAFYTRGLYSGVAYAVASNNEWCWWFDNTYFYFQSGSIPGTLPADYCRKTPPYQGTYTNIGGWQGIPTVPAGIPTATINSIYYNGGIYNGEYYYISNNTLATTAIIYKSITLQPNQWIIVLGSVPVESGLNNYCYSNTLYGTYTKVGLTQGTIIAAAEF